MKQITRTLLYMCAANVMLVTLIACGDGDQGGLGGSTSIVIDAPTTSGSCQPAQFRPTFDGIIRSPFLEWLPDGERILAQGGQDLHIVSSDGSQVTRLAERVFDRTASWYGRYVDISPDGTKVLYVSCEFVQETRERRRPVRAHEIMVVDVDSAEVRRLTENLEDDHLPVWSTDGSRIAFLSMEINKWWHLYTMDSDGSDPTDLAPSFNQRTYQFSLIDFFPPTWSPNGIAVAFVGWENLLTEARSFIYVTYDYPQIATMRGPSSITRIAETLSQPAWSPDGERLAYFGPKGEDGVALYTINADGSDRQEVIEIVGQEEPWTGELSWSPDGTQIRSSFNPAFVINTDGSGCRSFHADEQPVVVAWSPDSSEIAVITRPYYYFTSQTPEVLPSPEAVFTLQTMSADGTNRRVLAKSSRDHEHLTPEGAVATDFAVYDQPCNRPIEVSDSERTDMQLAKDQ